MPKSWVNLIVEREAQLGVDTLARMAKIFVQDSKNQLKTIDGSLRRNELATARSAVHDLVANAGALCFIVLESAARECETACINGDHAKATAAHKNLPGLVDICVVQLRDRYKLT
jgi:HPt (histidine-containing phosphotransfer) domain-containing protein